MIPAPSSIDESNVKCDARKQHSFVRKRKYHVARGHNSHVLFLCRFVCFRFLLRPLVPIAIELFAYGAQREQDRRISLKDNGVLVIFSGEMTSNHAFSCIRYRFEEQAGKSSSFWLTRVSFDIR